MNKLNIDVLIIGGGPAGLAAATGAHEAGVRDILILERESGLGGILKQCIHNGFGLHTFKEELTGPEYMQRYIDKIGELNLPYKLGTMVLSVSPDGRVAASARDGRAARRQGCRSSALIVTAVNAADGQFQINAKSVVLTCGCRERARGAVNIAGARVAGIYTAGTAQKYVNTMGYMPGRRVVVLGSGDIGLIMARRMTFEGAKVLAVLELLPYSSGLKRNIVQCLYDFNIPLYYSHTVTEIRGRERVEGVTAMRVDEKTLQPIPGTEMNFECDTLLLSVGLLPENELSKKAGIALSPVTGGPLVDETLMTNVIGIFAAGNMLHVHDLVDYVSEEASLAGANAARFARNESVKNLRGTEAGGSLIQVETGRGVRYTVPQFIRADTAVESVSLKFRVDNVYKNCRLNITAGEIPIIGMKKRVMAPGEMEVVTLGKAMLEKVKTNKQIKIEIQ